MEEERGKTVLTIGGVALCLGAAAFVGLRKTTLDVESQIAATVAQDDGETRDANGTTNESSDAQEIRRLASEHYDAKMKNDWTQILKLGRIIVADYSDEPLLHAARRDFVKALILDGAWDEAETEGRAFYVAWLAPDAEKAEKTWVESEERAVVLYGQGRRREALDVACSRLRKIGAASTEEGRLALAERLAVVVARPSVAWNPSTDYFRRNREKLDAAAEFVAALETTFEERGKPEATKAQVVCFQTAANALRERVESEEEAERRRVESAAASRYRSGDASSSKVGEVSLNAEAE